MNALSPATPVQSKPRAYKRFLTSAFHTRFVHAALLSLFICWDQAILLTPKYGEFAGHNERLWAIIDIGRHILVLVSTWPRWLEGPPLLLRHHLHLHPPSRHCDGGEADSDISLPTGPSEPVQCLHLQDLLLVHCFSMVVYRNLHMVQLKHDLGHKGRLDLPRQAE